MNYSQGVSVVISLLQSIRNAYRFPLEDEHILSLAETDIHKANIRNLKVLNWVLLVFSGFSLVSDIVMRGELTSSQYLGFLSADGLLLMLTIITAVFIHLFDFTERKRFATAYLFCYTVSGLFFAATVSSFEITASNINITYFIAIFVLANIFFLKFYQLAAAYTAGFLYYILVLKLIAPSVPHINLLLLYSFSASLFLLLFSRILYHSKYRSLIYLYSMENAIMEKERANESKTTFLRNISHELRTPLTGILGFADTLKDTAGNEVNKKYSQLIYAEGEKLLSLINRLLDVSKIEAGQLELNRYVFSLSECLEEFSRSYSERARLKGLEFSLHCAPELPEFVFGDRERVYQILVNIAGNAIKFTSRGSVHVDACGVDIREDSCTVQFSVSDTGIGIPEEQLDAVFDPFLQADRGISRMYGGTGLGLAITRQLIQLMGGHISVSSSIGSGSTFTFQIPFRLADRREVQIQLEDYSDTGILKGKRILVVEDYPVNRQIAETHLVNAGCEVVMAENGREALEKLKANTFDLILLDIQMPEMDGLEVIKFIRGTEELKEYSVIAMTANVFEEDRRNYISSGMDAVIAKPFRKREMLTQIEKVLTDRWESRQI